MFSGGYTDAEQEEFPVMKIYNLGSLNIDYVYSVPHFVQPGETLSSTRLQLFPGGKGLNQSVALARAGAQVVHGGCIGESGAFLKEILHSAGADVTWVRTGPEQTGHAIIQVDASGQNCILLFPGANHTFTPEFVDQILSGAQAGDILLLQNEINCLSYIFEAAHRRGMQIAFNPSPFRQELLELPLQYVGWWLCNEIEGAQLTGKQDPQQILDAMAARFPESKIVLTLGKDGCLCQSGDVQYSQPIFPVTAVDTTAAGDTFTGFFLACIADGKAVPEALRIASRASSIAVSRMGASASVPTLAEVLNDFK